jgi:hypothetical protein
VLPKDSLPCHLCIPAFQIVEVVILIRVFPLPCLDHFTSVRLLDCQTLKLLD